MLYLLCLKVFLFSLFRSLCFILFLFYFAPIALFFFPVLFRVDGTLGGQEFAFESHGESSEINDETVGYASSSEVVH